MADPNGRSSITLWIALDFCLRLRRWTVHLHSFLNQPKGIFAPKAYCPGSIPISQVRVGPRRPTIHGLPRRDLSQGLAWEPKVFWETHPSRPNSNLRHEVPEALTFTRWKSMPGR